MSSLSSESSSSSFRASKKFRMNADANYASDRYFTSSTGERERNVPPSPVVLVRGPVESISEENIRDVLSSYGEISYCLTFPAKKMALVEFEDVDSAKEVVRQSQENNLDLRDAVCSFSTSQSIKRRPRGEPERDGDETTSNCVILLSIQNVQYPITVEVIHAICSPFGSVQRIVIFRKHGVQSMVEFLCGFDSAETAMKAKESLQGADIYSNCCTIRAEFAKPTTLTVTRNGGDTWDYTIRTANDTPAPTRSKPLLPDPSPGGVIGSQFGHRPLPASQSAFSSYPPNSYNGVRAGSQWQQDNQSVMPRMGGGFDMGRPGLGAGPGGDRRSGGELYGGDGGRSAAGYDDYAEPSCVLMIYGLSVEHMNVFRLFNLLCLFGNVIRIKFLKNKDGSAMAQMRDREAFDRVISMLTGQHCHGSKLELNPSKQVYIQEIVSPYMLADNTPSYKDFAGSRNNRFSKPDAVKTRFHPPSRAVYFYNAPPNIEEDDLISALKDAGAATPKKVKILLAKSEKSSRGIILYEDSGTATAAISFANNTKIDHHSSKAPYVLKLAFTAVPRDDDDE